MQNLAACGSSQVATVVLLLRLSPLDITEAKDSMTLWTFDVVSKTLHERASQIEGENLYNLFVVERFLPSDEFIEAVGALTVVQKGHIGELSIGNRRTELDQVMNGIILSLADEVQIKIECAGNGAEPDREQQAIGSRGDVVVATGD
ncbi:unnamed protein product [Heligmosomoides polygyrus]|uniref:CPSF73-100_C domain-containing protein n=1 Tax=Heligmosomoides polygyrus TaxID=6339 RepID=A0A183G9L1_HELPZ|nr:unnamed protein product [Heligmosomoides polygyrus]